MAAKSLLDRFAENLRVERARANLTQGDLAGRARLSVAYVSLLERGQRNPPLLTIEALAKGLKVDPVKLLA